MSERGTCTVEGCDKPHMARGFCNLHWQRFRKYGSTDLPVRPAKKPKPKHRGPKAVVVQAAYSYKDRHPRSPSGQRIAVYVCPKCKGEHLVAWAPVDEHPGLKNSTCRVKTATATDDGVLVYVTAPEPDRQYEDEPKMPRLVVLDRHHLDSVVNL